MKSENDLLEQYEKAEPSALDTREKATDYTDCNEYLGYIGNVFCELRFGIAEDGSLEYISAQPLKAGSEGTLYDDSEYGYYGPPSFAEEKGVEDLTEALQVEILHLHMIMSVHYQKTKL